MKKVKFGFVTLSALVLIGAGGAALAQDAAPDPNAPRRQGQGNRAGAGVQVASIPADILATELKLNADQKTKIKAVQDKFAEETKAMRPAPGTQPDPESLRANFQKLRELSQQANKDIDAVLTEDQRKAVRPLVREISAMQQVGIPVGVMGDLKLTADQKTKIKGVVEEYEAARQAIPQEERRAKAQELRQAATGKVAAVLTDEQKAAIEKWRKENPNAGRRQRPGGANPPA